MTSFENSIFARVLRRLSDSVCKHPAWYVYPQILLFVLCVLYTKQNLKLDMGRDNLVGAKKQYHQNFLAFRKEFPGEDELVVVVESDNLDRNRQFVDRLGPKLLRETNLFTDIFYKGDIPSLGSKALLVFPERDLTELQKALADYRPFIEKFSSATNLNSLFELINTEFRTAKREKNEETESLIKAIPALRRIVTQANESLKLSGNPPSPGVEALFGAGEQAQQEIYLTFARGRIFLVNAKARNADVSAEAVDRLRELVQQTQLEVPGLNIGVTGEPVLELDEMKQSEHDSILASIASLIICSGIFIYAYRQTGRPLKAVACLIIGLGYTMGFTTLVVGHLNILTITFAPILIGLAIDFGIHYITRYEEEMRRGAAVEEAVFKATAYTGQGIVTGALTTAAAFLAMGLTDFKGIQEMGIISGGGLVLCLVPMLTMLPVLLMRGRHQNLIDHKMGAAAENRAKIENLWLERPALVSLVIVGICVFSVLQFKKVYFDYNLLHMQSRGLPAVVYDEKLVNSAEKSLLFAAVIADNPQQAREYQQLLSKLPTVATNANGEKQIESMATYLTENQDRKLALVRAIKQEIQSVHFAPTDTNAVRVDELSGTLWRTMGYLGLASDEAAKEDPEIAKELLSLRSSIVSLRKTMLSSDTADRKLASYQQALFSDLHNTFDALKNQDASSRLTVKDLPDSMRNRFIGVTGKQLLMVFPQKDIWNHENQREFIAELRSVIPENKVTGTPVQLYEYTTLLKNSYIEAAYYALGAIAIMVLLHFRSLSCVILALLPVAIGTIWLLGLMGFSDIPFNPANIMTLPLVIGIGVTNGIHILNRFAEERKAGILAKSTGKAVLVSGLTAIAGFGSLMLGKHQGIISLGFVMSVGIATCMVAALTFLPALLNILTKWGWSLHKKKTQ